MMDKQQREFCWIAGEYGDVLDPHNWLPHEVPGRSDRIRVMLGDVIPKALNVEFGLDAMARVVVGTQRLPTEHEAG